MVSIKSTSRELELLEICKNSQGGYVKANYPRTSWATTYSPEFIMATAELFQIYRETHDYYWTLIYLSAAFKGAGVLSCRGGIMNGHKLEYLFNKHISKHFNQTENICDFNALNKS